MTINRLRMPIPMARQVEDNNAREAKNAANIEYIAIMSDIDLDEDEEEMNDAQQEL